MRIFLVAVTAFLISITSASAAGIVSELTVFNDVIVRFNDTAKKCNLTDPSIFKQKVEAGLVDMGLSKSPSSRIVAVLNIAANGFGLLNSQCATTVTFNIQSSLNGKEILTDNPETRKILDHVGTFPISIYRSGMFGVQVQSEPSAGGESTSVRDAVLDMTDKMLNKLILQDIV